MTPEERIDIEVRLSTAMIHLKTNKEGLADRLGIGRPLLTAFSNGSKNLGPEPLRKLAELEKELNLVPNGTTQAKEEPAPYKTTCALCRDKDTEIRYLRDALEKANDNLSSMIELLQAKNTIADRASIVSSGSVGTHHKKGA